jgi:two-component system chemotaxis response regulator CheY
MKILVIEDDKHTRALIVRMLRMIGVRSIAEAEDGKTGYGELLRTRPHLVFCDVNMEPFDGREFLRRVRKTTLPGIADTPVVFLTGDAQQATVLFAKEHGVLGYLVKPVSLNDLKGRIDAVAAQKPAGVGAMESGQPAAEG